MPTTDPCTTIPHPLGICGGVGVGARLCLAPSSYIATSTYSIFPSFYSVFRLPHPQQIHLRHANNFDV